MVVTGHQTAGKGQRGNVWLSEPNKNLLFSVYLIPKLLARDAFLLNVITGLAAVRLVKIYLTTDLVELKWPNDLYVNDQKMGGILVETTLEGASIDSAIAGIGLNVNQKYFSLPQATSMSILTDSEFDLSELLEEFICHLEKYLILLKGGKYDLLIREYYDVMRWRGEMHQYKADGEIFQGEIIGIGATGKLMIRTNQEMRQFDIKEIEFIN